jgi:hypothetical protein
MELVNDTGFDPVDMVLSMSPGDSNPPRQLIAVTTVWR